jgi:hypothetical protein
MEKIIDDPQKETGLPTYPQEFTDSIKSGAKNLASKGYSQDQIQGWMTEKYKRYNSEHKGSDAQYEEMPDWAKSERIEMKNTTKKRGLINRIGRALSGSFGMTPMPTAYGGGVGVKYSNPMRDAGEEDVDVISVDMVKTTEDHVKTLLHENGRRDASLDVKEHIEGTRNSLAETYNPKNHRTQRWNNELLMEEAYSTIISGEVKERLDEVSASTGMTKTDMILTDPKKIKEMKKGYVEMGYTGKMVDRAFDKAIFEGKREVFTQQYDDDIIENNDPKTLEANKEVIGGNLYNSFLDRASERFNKDELQRMQQNIRLEELRKQKADPKLIAQVEDEIAILDDLLGYDTKEKAAQTGVAYAGGVFMPGGMSIPASAKIGTDQWEKEVYYRMYDKDGAKIMRGDETQEQVEHEQQVTEIIQSEDVQKIKELPDRLLEEGLKSEKILLTLYEKYDELEKQFSDYQEAKTLAMYGTHKQREEGLDPAALAAFEKAGEYKRRRDVVLEEIRQENIRHEAVSRMYLLNQNVALEDRNIKTLAGLGAATIRDINFLPFKNNPNPTVEQVRAYVNPIYEELGIELDSKEYEATINTLITEVIEGGAHLTDIAVKMMVLDKAGFAGFTRFFDLLGKGGKVWKAASGLAKMGLEEAKFQMVGGEKGTGAAFYMANKIMPTWKTKKPWFDMLWNGFMKGSAGMTIAMEGSMQIETAVHAAANDDDVIREMTEAFGPMDVAQRRMLVNFLSAAPFGVKGMYERGFMPKVTPDGMAKLADQVEKNGNPEAAAELRSHAATLGDGKIYEKFKQGMHKIDELKKNDMYDRHDSMAEIDAKYEKLMEQEGQVDALKNPKVSALIGKYDNQKVEFDAREFAGKVETLRMNKIEVTEKTPLSEIDAKYAEIIENGNAYMQNIKDRVDPVVGEVDAAVPTPTKKAKVKPRQAEGEIQQTKKNIASIVKDVNWKKAINAPAKHVAKTIKELKERVDAVSEAVDQRPAPYKSEEIDIKYETTPRLEARIAHERFGVDKMLSELERIESEGKYKDESLRTKEMDRFFPEVEGDYLKIESQADVAKAREVLSNYKKRATEELARRKKTGETDLPEGEYVMGRVAFKSKEELFKELEKMPRDESGIKVPEVLDINTMKAIEEFEGLRGKEIPEARRETFDEIIEKYSGLKNGTRELDAMVNMLFETKTKAEALEIMGKLEDVVHKVETVSRPEKGKLEFVTRSPNQGESTVSKYSEFRGNLLAYKRGQRDGREDVQNRANEVYEYVRTRISPKLVKKVLTDAEVKRLARPLPKNATVKDVAKKLEQLENLFVKLETRQYRADIQKKLRSLSPKVIGSKLTEGKLGVMSASKWVTSDVLFNNNVEGAQSIRTKLQTLRKGFEGDQFALDFIDAQIKALETTGSRELAMERQAQLEVEHTLRELTMAEKMEYELLNMVDGSKMNHVDALRAKETLGEIERTGRLVQERVAQADKLKKAIDVEEGLASLNVDQVKVEEVRQINPKKPGFGEAMIARIKEASKYVGTSHESFITMMEMLSSNDPNRESSWDGFFHTMSRDFHRSRERENGEKNRKLNKMRADIEDITGLKGRRFDKWAKRNSKKTHKFIYDIANNVQEIKNGVTVDQAVRWWQLLHNKATWPLWGKSGFGVKGEKFEVKEVERLMSAIEDFIVKNNGDRKALDVAEYQMNQYSELYRDVNEVYSKQHGVDLGYTMHYVPVVFEKGVRIDSEGKTVDLESYNDLLEKGSEYRVASSAPVFTKATQRSKGIKLDLSLGSEQVFADYLSSAMHYKHFQEPLRRADQVLTSNKMTEAIRAKYGDKAGKYINKVIDKQLKDIGADVASGTKIKWLTTLKNNFTVANLGANVILLPKQMMSVDAYRAGLANKGEEALFTRYLSSFMIDGWGAMGELNSSEMMINRAAGHSYNRELVEMQKKASRLYKTGKIRPGNVREGLLFMTKLGDRGAILMGGQALYRTKIDVYKKQGMSEKAAKQKAYEDFVTYTKLTQQSGNIEDLGHIQRAGTLGKYATLFQNTPQQYYRMEMAAVRNGTNAVRRNRDKNITPEERARNKQIIKRSARDFVVYHFILPMTFRAASQGFYLGGDDKGRDRFIDDEGQAVTAILGTLAYPFMLGDMLTNMTSKAIAGHSFKTEVGGILQDIITGTEEAYDTFKDIVEAEEWQLEWRRIMDGTAPITWEDIIAVFGTAAEYGGIPFRSPALMAKGISDYRNYRTDDIRSWAGYGTGVTGTYERSPQFNVMAPYFGEVDEETGKVTPPDVEGFLAKMRKTTDPDYYTNNEKRWRDEIRMYNEFGGYNDDVNYLYTTAKTNKERAKFMRGIRDGKGMRGPTSIADIIQAMRPPMNHAEYMEYQTKLLEYGVITKEVIKEMAAQDLGYKEKMIAPFRKTGE